MNRILGVWDGRTADAFVSLGVSIPIINLVFDGITRARIAFDCLVDPLARFGRPHKTENEKRLNQDDLVYRMPA